MLSFTTKNLVKVRMLLFISSMGKNEYSYTDASPVNGINYYRIKQNDRDGRYSYSETRVVCMNKQPGSFEVVSNPVLNKTLQLQINTTTGQNVSLFNSDGKLIWKKELSPGMHAIGISTLAAGMYILRSENGSQKLMVQ